MKKTSFIVTYKYRLTLFLDYVWFLRITTLIVVATIKTFIANCFSIYFKQLIIFWVIQRDLFSFIVKFNANDNQKFAYVSRTITNFYVHTVCVNFVFSGMGLVSSPFASMNPFALPTCNSQSYGSSPLVGTTK